MLNKLATLTLLVNLLVLPILTSQALESDPSKKEEFKPWFIGPLLTPSPYVEPPGRINFQPYMFMTKDIGYFNNTWALQTDLDNSQFQINWNTVIQLGIIDRFGAKLIPQGFYTSNEGRNSYSVGDLTLQLQYQVYREGEDGPLPTMQLAVAESFPIGSYDNLDPTLNGTDIGGSGAYATTFSYTIGTIYHVTGEQYFRPRLSLQYTISTDVDISNSSSYGGGPGTSGTITPGQSASFYLGLEYSLDQNFVLALDIAGTYNSETSFSGNNAGFSAGSPESWVFSVAPGLEYNVSENLGFIAGVWLPFAGENTPDFVSGVISLVWDTDFRFQE